MTDAPSPGRGLKARTLAHASLAVYRDSERPLLLTDPWLVGSVYWRSWWLQHYPSAAEIEWLATAAHVYATGSASTIICRSRASGLLPSRQRLGQ